MKLNTCFAVMILALAFINKGFAVELCENEPLGNLPKGLTISLKTSVKVVKGTRKGAIPGTRDCSLSINRGLPEENLEIQPRELELDKVFEGKYLNVDDKTHVVDSITCDHELSVKSFISALGNSVEIKGIKVIKEADCKYKKLSDSDKDKVDADARMKEVSGKQSNSKKSKGHSEAEQVH